MKHPILSLAICFFFITSCEIEDGLYSSESQSVSKWDEMMLFNPEVVFISDSSATFTFDFTGWDTEGNLVPKPTPDEVSFFGEEDGWEFELHEIIELPRNSPEPFSSLVLFDWSTRLSDYDLFNERNELMNQQRHWSR